MHVILSNLRFSCGVDWCELTWFHCLSHAPAGDHTESDFKLKKQTNKMFLNKYSKHPTKSKTSDGEGSQKTVVISS